MPKIDLGRVRGEDARFGNITSSYINDGGEPGVDIVPSGPDTGKDLDFEFRNLVNDPLSSSEIEKIANGEVVNSANVLNGTGLTTLWARIKEKFAAKAHRHSAADIEEGQFGADRIEDNAITSAKIADGAVGQEQLDPAVWESISQKPKTWVYSAFPYNKPTDMNNWGVFTRLNEVQGGDNYYIAVNTNSMYRGSQTNGKETVIWTKIG